jgi:hypothetical protein
VGKGSEKIRRGSGKWLNSQTLLIDSETRFIERCLGISSQPAKSIFTIFIGFLGGFATIKFCLEFTTESFGSIKSSVLAIFLDS